MKLVSKNNTYKDQLRISKFRQINFGQVLIGLFTISLMMPLSVCSQESKLTKVAKLDNKKNDSVFVISDEELKSFSNTSELIREVKLLRKDNAALVDYSKKIREKFKDLQRQYSNDGTSCPVISVSSERSAENEAQVAFLKQENQKIVQQIQNLKTEYAALKLENSSIKAENKTLKEDYAKYKEDTTSKVTDGEKGIEELQRQLSQKTQESHACMEQVDQSQKLVLQIPELEKEILGLKNELLMRKSAAELLGSSEYKQPQDGSKNQVGNLGKVAGARKVETREVSDFNLSQDFNSDVMIVEIVADKVALRAGPGQENSTIMDIAKGARLTVEAREGEWLRVNAPTGGRAYVHSGLVRVIDNGQKIAVAKQTNSQTTLVDQKTDLGVNYNKEDENKLVPLEVEPVRPPLPQKPVKRSVKNRSQLGSDPVQDLKLDKGIESAALEAIKKGMSGE